VTLVFAHIGSSNARRRARALAGLILAFGLLVPARAPAQDKASDAPTTGILLAQTGWTSAPNDIATARLKAEYCAGRVQKTARAAATARQILGCDPGAEVVDPQAFRTQSKDRIILVDLAEAIPLMKTLTVDAVLFFRDPAKYPLTLPASPPLPPLTHMIMTGTTAISRYTGRSADQYGPAVLTEKVAPYFRNADYVHISNEVSFMDRCAFEAGLKFCSKQAHFQAFKDIGVNVVELTGNHNRDFGNGPMLATLAWFRQNGMRTFGGGRDEADANTPIFLDLKGGGAIGMIGFNELCPLAECAAGQTPGANRFKLDKARADIRDMKQKRPDAFIIVTVQFGEDSSYRPTSSQHSISLALVEAGADLVFGSQAHQVQQMEFHQGKVILYGLGNFLFDQIHATGVRQGYFMNLYFLRGRLAAMEPVFTWIDEKRRPAIATAEQAAAIRKAIYADALLYK
jgi:poly-gamma-glutamate capsule biosynthesis protein CapA/YwtB (metallophosphatase superfamily)